MSIAIYKTENWLKKKYLEEKLSTIQIGKKCSLNAETIRCWMKRNNISRRSYSEYNHLGKANHCQLSQEAINWINGELLGDGHLYSHSIYSAGFSYGSKYYEYIKYVLDKLNFFGIEKVGKIRKEYHEEFNSFSYSYQSRSYVELLPIRKKWYPNGKKIVPKDIKLLPSTIRQWYIGDGSLIHPKKGRPYILLCTKGFIVSDVKFLIKKLIELKFKATRELFQNRIHISTFSTEQFLKYIGNCPVKCYQYKFNYIKE